MRTTERTELKQMLGQMMFSADGAKLGEVREIFIDDSTGEPEWLSVKTGWFGGRRSFIPLADAENPDDGVHVPFDKAKVKEAPTGATEGVLSPEEEETISRHYNRDPGMRANGPETAGRERPSQATGRENSGDAMTRSEEELRVGTHTDEAGRTRLRKWVETEHVSDTVTVRREEARVVREPITGDNVDQATSGPEIRENTHEMTLNEERVVVGKETVPKERVRLEKEVFTEEVPVEADLRKERIEAEGDLGKRRS